MGTTFGEVGEVAREVQGALPSPRAIPVLCILARIGEGTQEERRKTLLRGERPHDGTAHCRTALPSLVSPSGPKEGKTGHPPSYKGDRGLASSPARCDSVMLLVAFEKGFEP